MTEGFTQLYLFAGTISSLNTDGISAKTLYSSQMALVDAADYTSDWQLEVTGIQLYVDRLSPVVYGWQETEVEPNDCDSEGDPSAWPECAQALPEASSMDEVDLDAVSALMELDSALDGSGYGASVDAFSLTVPDTRSAMLTGAWAGGESINLDWYLYDDGGTALAAGWQISDTNPESSDLYNDFGVVFQPGRSYYVFVYPWLGPEGDLPYTLEFEWTAVP